MPRWSKSSMEVLKLVLVALTVLLAAVPCCTFEDSTDTEEAVDAVNRLTSAQPASGADQLQNCEDGDSLKCKRPSLPQEEINFEGDTADAAGTEREGNEVRSWRRRNDPLEGESYSDSDDESIPTQPKLILQAFGPLGGDGEAEETDRSETKQDEVWTEQTEDGTDQKRTGGRRFFSLMNLIKFLLNPMIEEFQDMDKASTNQDATTAADTNNQSNIVSLPTGNASDVGDKEKRNSTESGKKTKFQCVGRNITENTTALVRIVNSTILLELLSFDKNHTTSDCVLVMFYAPWCHFCTATAPHYNAVARAFPQLEVIAVDTVHFSNLNARFGTVAVPNIMLFHQSRSAVRFNHTERHLQTLVQFITNTTGLEANSSVELSAEDYDGPLSSTPTEETDYLLWFAWFFIIVCSGHIFISSQMGQHAIERVMVLWQEHQHQHIE